MEGLALYGITIKKKIYYCSFNQDSSCLAVGTENGFKIYSIFPLREISSRLFDCGIRIIEMLDKSNILILVRYSPNPNNVILWDDNQGKILTELNFSSKIKSTKLKSDKIFVISQNKIHIFNFLTLQIIEVIDTFANPRGIFAIARLEKIIAYPDISEGYVRVKCQEPSMNTPLINAHDYPIAALALNEKGTLLATASDYGTIIRIFKVGEGDLLLELRRGTEKAGIYNLVFSFDSRFIMSSSNRGTVHIFALTSALKYFKKEQINLLNVDEDENFEPKNQKSVIGKIIKFLKMPKNYWNSEWSFAQFRITEKDTVCAFGPDNRIFVASLEGKYYEAQFDPRFGGECKAKIERDLHGKEINI